MRSAGSLALLVALGALLTASPAGAFERQWHLGGGLGLGAFTDAAARPGPVLGLHGAYGLSDTFDLRLAVLGAGYRLEDSAGEPHGRSLAAVTAGLAYKLDVIAWVPYAGLQVGYYRLGSALRPGVLAANEAGFSVDLGLDYAVRRHLGVGVELRYHGFLSDPLRSLGEAPWFTGLLRAEYRWGW